MVKLQRRLRYEKVAEQCRGRVLDIGCGDRALAGFVDRYTGVDKDWGFKKVGSFDTITLVAVLEHIPVGDLAKLRDGILKNLKKGGRVVITTPLPKAVFPFGFLKHAGVEMTDDHKLYYTRLGLEGFALFLGKKLIYYKTFALGFNQVAVIR